MDQREIFQVGSRGKYVHVDITSKTMKDKTYLIVEVIKGESVRKFYDTRISINPTMAREQYSKAR